MTPDATIKDYYYNFISNVSKDIISYKECLAKIRYSKEELYTYIDNNKELLINTYSIDITKYDLEWNKKTYSDSEALYNRCIKYINIISNTDSNKIILLQVIKYCNALRNEYRFKKLYNLAYVRKNLKFSDYRNIVVKYYNEVHKCVLQGMCYKFTHGIGEYIINYNKLTSKNPKLYLDYNATKLKKKEIIDKGLKPFDEAEAIWYKARNIPYDGVDYRIYKNNTHVYEFTFMDSKLCPRNSLEYDRTEYVYKIYRGLGYEKVANNMSNNITDICNLHVDIKYKLNIILHKDPNKYLNFIRNAEQSKYKYRTYYSKNR